MSIEIQMLVWSIALGIVYMLIAVSLAAAQRGTGWAVSSREDNAPLTGAAGRLDRAQRNFLETFGFFAAAVLLVHTLGRESHVTALGAQLYFWGRLTYLPLYGLGVKVVRSLAWGVAMAGIVMLLWALF